MVWFFCLLSLVNIVCFSMVLIKMFSDESDGGVGKGILGLFCGLYAFVWGWQHRRVHDMNTLMLTWTVVIALSILLQALLMNQVSVPAS